MPLEEGRIEPLQLVILVTGFVFGSSVVLVPGGLAGRDAWISVLLGMGEGLLIVMVFSFLMRRFPGQTLPEIAETVFGRIPGKIISLFFLAFLLHLCSLVVGNYGDFLATVSLPETPKLVFTGMLIAICAMAVAEGVESIARAGQILVPLTIFSFLFSFVWAFPMMNLHNLQPILTEKPAKILWAAHAAAAFPFAETVAFVMVLPFLAPHARRKGPSAMALALAVAVIFFILAFVRNIGVLGPLSRIATYPSYEAVRQVEISRVKLRLEILIALNFLSMGFLKVAVLYYGTVLGLAQVFRLASYRSLVVPVGLLAIVLSVLNFTSIAENIELANVSYAVYAPIFEALIPLCTLLLAVLRKLPKE